MSLEMLSPNEFKSLIVKLCRSMDDPISVICLGPPGVGKTTAVIEAAAELKRELFILSLSRCEAFDLRGMPYAGEGGFLEWKPPHIFKKITELGGEAILFLDELTIADQSTISAALDILLSKRIDSDVLLPRKLLIVAAGNMVDDGSGAKNLSTAITGGRTMMFELRKPGVKEWCEYQKPEKFIADFLTRHPGHLFRMPNANAVFSVPWSNPRGWSQLDRLVKSLSLKVISDTEEIIRYARALVSEDSALLLADGLKEAGISPEMLLDKDPEALERFKGHLLARQKMDISKVLELVKGRKIDDTFIEKLQGFLDFVVGIQVPADVIMTTWCLELSKISPTAFRRLKVGMLSLEEYANNKSQAGQTPF